MSPGGDLLEQAGLDDCASRILQRHRHSGSDKQANGRRVALRELVIAKRIGGYDEWHIASDREREGRRTGKVLAACLKLGFELTWLIIDLPGNLALTGSNQICP